MDPVRPHEQVAADRFSRIEVRRYLRVILRIGHNPVAQLHRAGLPVPQGAGKGAGQVRAVDVQVLPAPPRAGGFPQGNCQDAAPALAKPQLLLPWPERIFLDARRNPERLEHAHTVGADLQAGADFLKHAGLVQNGHPVTQILACPRGRQPPDTAT